MQDNIYYKGLFWLPEYPENKVTGSLTYSPEEGITLELIGFLGETKNSIEFFEPQIINGFTTNGKKITLYKCYESNRSRSFPGMETSIIHSNYLFVGAHFTSENEIAFDKIAIRIKNLDEWLGISGFRIDYNEKDYSTNIKYKLPESIKFNFSKEFKAIFNFIASNPSIRIFIKKTSIEQFVQLIIEPTVNKKIFFKDFLDEVFKFQMFLTFATYSAAYPLEIIFYSSTYFLEFDDKKIPEEIKLFYMTSIKSSKHETTHWDMLFSFNDIKTEFDNIMLSWYEKQEKLNSILGLFLDTFYNPNIFNENRFLNIVQALESIHRRFIRNEILTKAEHKLRLEEILSSTPEKHNDWLNQKLLFSNEPTLKERLEELLNNYSNDTLKKVIKDPADFIKKVKDSRNYYTHFDSKLKKKAAKGGDLYYLTERMKLLLTCCLLNIIGFNNNLIQQLLKKNEYRHYNHLY